MRVAGFTFGLLLGMVVLDACQAPRAPALRRPRETHRVVVGRP